MKRITAGIDPGSSSVKVVIAESDVGANARILASSVQRIRRRSVLDVVRAAWDEACTTAGVKPSDMAYIASTGDGEVVDFRTGHFYSMTTHARGALFLDPEARGVLDMGGLHARGLKMNEQGRVLAHRMTSQCASGSGQFVENIARYLGVSLEEVGELSKSSASPEKVSSICAVLAETDVINMVSRGISTADILKGIHLSIAGRLVQLIRAVGAEGKVVLTGGLSRDVGMVTAIQQTLDGDARRGDNKAKKSRKVIADIVIETFPDAILAGAIGAALLGALRHEQLRGRSTQPMEGALHG